MKLNEHASKEIFSRALIPVPPGVLLTPETVKDFTPASEGPWMLKAQVISGGRGLAGGIREVTTKENVAGEAERLFKESINDEPVRLLRLESKAKISSEHYVSFTLDRESRSYVLTTGRKGGVTVESLPPSNFLISRIDPVLGLQPHHIRAAFFHLGVDAALWQEFSPLLSALFSSMQKNGLLMAEINPLAVTSDNHWLALDGKVEMDENFIFCHPDLEKYRHPGHITETENRARAANLSYHQLKGWVGLMANGAGLAMATMDLLHHSGLPPANFLDLGGGADEQQMTEAVDILLSNRDVTAVFINIFGGILSCEKTAKALLSALSSRQADKPVVVRLAGNRAEEGKVLLEHQQLDNLHMASDLNQAMELLHGFSRKPAQPGDSREPVIEPASRTVAPSIPHDASQYLPFSRKTRLCVQGITGKQGRLHTELMLAYGTRVVAGVTPFKGGQTFLDIPVYDSLALARDDHGVDASIIFVPPVMAADAILEAVENEIPWIVAVTEHIPQQDMLKVTSRLKNSPSRLIGPNTPGVIIPGQTKIGIMPGDIFLQGPVAVLSRSGTLTYEVVHGLTRRGWGQRFVCGIGGDPVTGSTYTDFLSTLEADPGTEALVMLGEIGGTLEESLAKSLEEGIFSKPVIAFIAGSTAPPGKTLGHAGAIVKTGEGGAKNKLERLQEAGCVLCEDIRDMPGLVSGTVTSRQP